MAEYIEREAFIAEQRHLYCENCARRKGMKNGKMKFVYAIGEVPCRACEIGDVLDSVEDYPAADVAPVVRCGECEHWWDNGTDLCSCERDALLRRRDFFCADGERKDGDGDV